MGYYSDVRIKLKTQDYNKLLKVANQALKDWLLDHNNMDLNIVREDDVFNKHTYEYETKDIVYFGWDSVKWYDGYEDVDCIMNFIRGCDAYAFARIGETTGDIEQEAFNMYDIPVICTFEE